MKGGNVIGIISRAARVLGNEPVAAPVSLPGGVELRRSRLVPRIAGLLAGMRGPAAAVTLGRTILVAPRVPMTDRLLRHELAHVRQWEREPLSFPFRYIASHIRHGYGDNPYEAEARAAETGPHVSGEVQ
jgi:hypothetical protein